MTIRGIGIPRRHAPGVYRLKNGIAPSHHLFVFGQRKRSDFAGSVAFHTILIQNPRDLFTKSDLGIGKRGSDSSNRTSGRVGPCNSDRFASQQLIQCNSQIPPRRLNTRHSRLVLIINTAAITDRQRLIQHEDFGHKASAKLVCHFVTGILQDRKRDPVLFAVVCHFLGGILRIAVHTNEPHILSGELIRQRIESWTILPRHRTLGSQKAHDRPLRSRLRFDNDPLSRAIEQFKSGNRLRRGLNGRIVGVGPDIHDDQTDDEVHQKSAIEHNAYSFRHSFVNSRGLP